MTQTKKIISSNGQPMLSAKAAAKRLSCAPDYVGKLCREGKLVGTRENNGWFVDAASLEAFESTRTAAKAERSRELSQMRKRENKAYQEANSLSTASVLEPRSSLDIRTPHPAFSSHHFGLVAAASLLVGVLVVGASGFIKNASHEAALSAALAQVESPFFGTGAQVSVPDFGTAMGRLWNALFGAPSARIAAEPAVKSSPAEFPETISASSTPLTTPAVSAVAAAPIIQNVYPIRERIVQQVATHAGVSEQLLMSSLEQLGNQLRSEFYTSLNTASGFPASGGIVNNVALSQRIDKLSGVAISNATINGLSGLTDADIPDTITASNYLALNGHSAGDLFYSNASGVLTRLPIGTTGQVLKVQGGVPVWGISAGGGGSGAWATSTDNLAIYPVDPSQVVLVGDTATTTTGTIFELTGNALFRNAVTAYGNVTAPRFVATSTTASILPYASSTALTVAGTAYFATASTTNLVVSGLRSALLTTDATGNVTATTSLGVAYGGTGVSSAPSYGQVLVGNASGGYDLVATSSLGISGGSGGDGFSTTSADYWSSTKNFTGFSTTSANYWSSLGLGFSTTSANYWGSVNNFTGFSTSSANYWFAQGASTTQLSVLDGIAVGRSASTTIYGAATSTFAGGLVVNGGGLRVSTLNSGSCDVKADSNGTLYCGTDSSGGGGADFAFVPTSNYGALANATSTPLWFQAGLQASSTSYLANAVIDTATTTNLAVTGVVGTLLKTDALGRIVAAIAGTDYQTFGYPFIGNATSTALAFDGGLTAAGATTTALSVTGSTTIAGVLNAVGGAVFDAVTIGSLNGPLQANNGVISATSSIGVLYGGTGLSSAPSYGQLLVGTGTGYSLSATSTLGLLGSSSISAAGPLSWNSSTGALIISQAGNAADGYLSSADWNIFNEKVSSSSLYAVVASAFPFTSTTNYGALANATSTPLWLQSGLQASSTSRFVDVTASTATTTNLALLAVTSSLLKTNSLGQVVAAVAGSDYVTPGQVGASFAWTPSTFGASNANATSTLIGFNAGLYALASSTIGNGTQAGGLTVSGGATTTGTLYVGGTGTSTYNGGIIIAGGIVPSVSNTYSLGAPDKVWHSVFVGPGSLYVNNQKVISTNGSNDVVVSTDPGENLVLQTSGSSNIEINPAGGQVLLKNTINVSAGKSITTTDLSALPIPSGIAAGNITVSSNSITASNLNGGISLTPNGSGGVYVTLGNFGIGTTSPSQKLSVSGNAYVSGSLALGSALGTSFGGTGTSTAPSYGQLLLGNALGGYDLVATSTLGLGFSTTSANYWAGTQNFLGFSTTSADYWSSLGLGFSTTSATYFAHASTSIAKTYSNNVFTGTNSFSNLSLGSLNGPLQANNGVISATSSIGVLYGGTGLSAAPGYGQILIGDGLGNYTFTSTSTLGISATDIATGTLAVQYGGTGVSSITGLVVGNGTTPFSSITDSLGLKNVLTDETGSGALVFANNPQLSSPTVSGLLSAANASTSLLSVTRNAYFGATATSSFDSSGVLTLASALAASSGGTGLSTVSPAGVLVGNYAGTGWQQLSTSSLGLRTTNVAEGSNLYYTDGRVQSYLDTLDKGYFFSTTSANYFAGASTTIAKTYTNNTFTGSNLFSSLTNFTGLISSASSTIGDGTQTGGLTISGNATTTGSSYIAGSLGIGIPAPSKNLDVAGTARISSTLTLTGSAACTGGQALQTNGSGDITCGTITTAGVSTAGGWTTNNLGQVFLATTTDTVGVGATSTPYAKLSVLSGAAATTTLALVPALSQTANIIDIYNTQGALASVLTAAGRFGLGTTTPGATLSIEGASLLGNSATAGYFVATTSAASVLPYASSTGLTVSGTGYFGTATTTALNVSGTAAFQSLPSSLLSTNASGVAQLTTVSQPLSFSGSTLSLNIGAGLTTSGGNLILNMNSANNWLALQTFSGGASSTALSSLDGVFVGRTATTTIRGDGNTSTFAGGITAYASSTIGNSTQTGGLTVSGGATTTGNAYFGGRVEIGGGSSVINALLSNNGYLEWKSSTGTTGQIGIYGTSANALSFYTGANNRLNITSGGLIGIGTTSPYRQLSVGNDAVFGGDVIAAYFTATSTTIPSAFNGGLTAYASSTIGNGVQDGGLTIFGGATTTGSSYIAGGARIAGTLTLSGSANCTGQQALQTGTNGEVQCGTVNLTGITSAGGWTTDTFGSVYISTSTDRVGVGATSTPYAKLSVLSGAAGTTTLALVPASGQSANIIDIYNTSGALASVLTAAGNFGLGVTAPSYRLEVSGDGRFTGLVDAARIVATSTTATSTFAGLVGIGTTTPTEKLGIQGNLFLSGNLSNVANITATGTLAIGGAITSTATTANTFPYASTTALTVSGNSYLGAATSTSFNANTANIGAITAGSLNISGAITSTAGSATILPYASSTALTVSGVGYFGTASTTNLVISGLLANRVPYTTTGGAITSSSNFTFDGTTLGVNALTLSNALGIASGGTNASSFATAGNGVYYDGTRLVTAGNSPVTIPYASTTVLTVNGNAYINDIIFAQGSTTLQNFTFDYATGTAATTTAFYSTVASSSRLFAGTAAISSLTLANPLAVSSGGSGANSLTGILIGNGTSPFTTVVDSLGLANNLNDETGTGVLVFNNSPYFTGKVGIGTTSPYAALSVVGGSGVVANVFTATSTSAVNVFPLASTTQLTISSAPSALLSTNASGAVSAASIISPLAFSGGLLSIDQATAGQGGYLTATDWNTFNNKISSTSLSGTGPITYDSLTGVLGFDTSVANTFTGLQRFYTASSSLLSVTGTAYFGGTATTTIDAAGNLAVAGNFTGAGLSSCASSQDKLVWTGGQFACAFDAGANGTEFNWIFFNGSGVRLGTTTNQVLIGITATSSGIVPTAALNVIGGAGIDFATTTALFSTIASSTNLSVGNTALIYGNLGLGSSTPYAKLSVEGGNIIQTAATDPVLSTSTVSAGYTYASAVQGRYVYVADNTGGLRIFDNQNPQNLTEVGAYTGISGAVSVAVAGRYAYVADTSAGLAIVDVSNPALPTLAGSYASGDSYGIALSGKYAFVGNLSGGAVNVIDVSNPAAPTLVSTISTGGAPYGLYAQGRYLYIASQASPKFRIVDISNAAAPALLGSLTTGLNFPTSIAISGRYAYIGDATKGLQIIDIGNPASLSIVGSFDTSAGYYGVAVAGNYVYAADHAGLVKVIDVRTPSAPRAAGSLTLPSGAPQSITVAGKYAYVANDDQGLAVIDLNGIEGPAASLGSLAAGSANIDDNLSVGNSIFAGGGLNVGISGIFSRGTISAYLASSTQQNATVANFMGGNVGVGTTSPYRTLSVNGSGVFGGNLLADYFTATGTTASVFPYASSTALTVSGTAFLSTASTTNLTATTATTTNLAVTGITSALLKTNSLGQLVAAVAGDDYVSPFAASTYREWNIIAGTYLAPTSTLGIIVNASSTIGNGLQGGGLTISGGATTTGNAYFAGNIGIGTTSPGASLHIAGNDSGEELVIGDDLWDANDSTNRIQLGNVDGSSFIRFGQNTSNYGIIGWQYNSTPANSYISLLSNGGSNPLVLQRDGGNVGIGTTSPYRQLSVGNSAIFGGDILAAYFTATSTSQASTFPFASTTVISSTGGAYFATSAGSVGIGTTTPYAKLGVSGTVAATNFNADSASATSTFAGGLNVGNGALVYDYSGGYTAIQNLQLGALSFDADAGQVSWVDLPITSNAAAGTVQSYSALIGGSPVLTVYGEADGQGNAQNLRVGIGTTSPYSKLTLWGDNTASGSTTLAVVNAASTTVLSVDNAGKTTLLFASSTALTAGNLFFSSATSTGSLYVAASTTIAGAFNALGNSLLGNATSSGAFAVTGSTTIASVLNALGGANFGTLTATGLANFNGGLTAYASSTIGSGSQAGGLTISGGATTTGTSYLAAALGVLTQPSSSYAINAAGNINIDQYSSFKIAGNSVLYASSTSRSVAVGYATGGSLFSKAGTSDSVAIGYNALNSGSLTGTNNTAIGSGALSSNQGAQDNIGIGVSALNQTTSGGFNVGIGGSAGYYNTTGINNTYIGYQAGIGQSGQRASENVGIGFKALNNITATTDTYNVAIGYQAGTSLTSGANNILIGPSINSASVGSVTTGNNNISIGFDIALPSATGNNQLNIGNLVYGTGLGSGGTYSAGKVGVASTSPFAKLSVHLNNGDASPFAFAIGSSTANSTTTLFKVDNNGNVTVAGALQVGSFNTAGLALSGVGFNMSLASDGSGNIVSTSTPSVAAILATSTTATSQFAGRVSVGSSTPFAKFSIHTNNGDSNPVVFAIGSSTANSTTTLFKVDNNGNVTAAGALQVGSFATAGLALSGVGFNMVLASDGSGNIVASSTPSAAAFLATSTTATSTFAGGFTAGNGALVINKSAPSNSVVVAPTGNVGIGTSSPYAALSVAGASGVVANIFTATSTTATSTFLGGFNIGGASGFTYDRFTGRIGIGTVSPTQKLEVSGNILGTNINNVNCQAGYTITGFDTSGNIVCTVVPTASTTASSVKLLGFGNNGTSRYSTYFQTTDGQIFAAGLNSNYELGNGDANQRNIPTLVALPAGKFASTTVAAGYGAYAVMTDGTAYAWGYNGYGQLGVGDTTARTTPTPISGLTNVKKIVTSSQGASNNSAYGACALTTAGLLYCWGYNGYGQVGNGGTGSAVSTPYLVTGIGTVTDVTTGDDQYMTVCAINSNKDLYCWGYNGYGQVGNGNQSNQSSPVLISTAASGLASSTVLVKTGAQGSGGYTCAIKTNGQLYCWGYNGYGNLGVGDTTLRTSPTAVTNASSTADVFMGGANYNSTFYIAQNGKLYAAGYNGYGQLGDYSTTQRTSFVSVATTTGSITDVQMISSGSYGVTCILNSVGLVYCFGYGGTGQHGYGGTSHRYGVFSGQLSPTDTGAVPGLNNTVQIAGNGYTNEGEFCALAASGVVKCWGYNNSYGELGLSQAGTSFNSAVVQSTPATLVIQGSSNLGYWDKKDSNLYYLQGNVGIGTTTALGKLTVTGTGTGANSTFLLTDMNQRTNFTVLDNGRVGIGTSSPYAKLSVTGQTVAEYFTATSTTAVNNFPVLLSTSATTTNLAATNFTLGSYSGVLKATNGIVSAASQLDLTSDVVGILPVANGGTGFDSYSPGDLLYASDANTLTRLARGSDGQVLKLTSGVPTWAPETGGGGGGGGSSLWATTTNNGAVYPVDTSDVLVVGSNATTTTGSILEVYGKAYFSSSVGVGTSSPWAKFSIASSNLGASPAFAIGSSTGTQFVVDNGGRVGIGTSTPYAQLGVNKTASAPQLSLGYDASTYTDFRTDATGNLWILPVGSSGGGVYLPNDNLYVCSGGSLTSNACPSGTPSGKGNLVVQNKLGIGTSTPNSNLAVAGTRPSISLTDTAAGTNLKHWVFSSMGGNLYIGTSTDAYATTTTAALTLTNGGRVGVGTTTPTKQLSISDLLFVGANGTTSMGVATSTFMGDIRIIGKLDVSTIDPVYTIDGVKYATYGHSTVGIFEETLQTVRLAEKDATGKYVYRIAFDTLEKGSDFWLFYQITTFGKEWQDLVVSLTPAFEGSVYYEKDIAANALVIRSDKPGEVSLRLGAARYDSAKWPNLRPDQDGDTRGSHVVPSKPAQAAPAGHDVSARIEANR